MAGSIVVAYDGSDAARRALTRAAELRGADDHVVVVTATPSVYPAPYAVMDSDEEPKTKALLEEATSLFARHGVEAERQMPVGEPGAAIVEVARQVDASLVVVGRRRDSLRQHLLGSVSSHVVAHAGCDVLVVR